MSQTEKPRLVVIGHGMVAHRFCEALAQRDGAARFDVTVLGEEPRTAYDRVQLTKFFETRSADSLALTDEAWYGDRGMTLRLGAKAVRIDREAKLVHLEDGAEIAYDELVLATGSSAFVPPLPGVELDGVFVYRTIEDVEAILARCADAKTCAVIGGGLLGLEAARAVQQEGLDTHVIEMAPRLMPRQLDATGGRLLKRAIEAMDVKVHLGRGPKKVVGTDRVEALAFDDDTLAIDMLVVSCGIRPRDELARDAGLDLGARGGVSVDSQMRTSDAAISAIGEVAAYDGACFGLVGPGYAMAETLAARLTGDAAQPFEGADMSTKLKLLGVDVASFGDPFAGGEDAPVVSIQDFKRGTYKKLVLDESGKRLLGGILVGDASEYALLHHYWSSGDALPEDPSSLIAPAADGAAPRGPDAMPDAAMVCSCNNVTKGAICAAVRDGGCGTLAETKTCSNAGTGCGGCMTTVKALFELEMKKSGRTVDKRLCEHFAQSRQELFDIVRVTGIRSFDRLLEKYGEGDAGCEICKPTAASLFASLSAEPILREHATLQDTNDRFLANIQRRGLYSVVPRIPGGEISPERLITLGEIAKRFGLYTKITGGQRVDMFGAKLAELPEIWETLVDAGFESGHAYAKGMRTIKSCVGSTWCRYGVDDSVGLAIRLEERYRGIRAPHKFKSAVSGCARECAEAQSKDFGVIATEKGWALYVCGNGGAKPRHADLLATDLDEATLVRYIDRFLAYYISTADKLTRTSVWVEGIEGGIDHVRDVVVNDSLGLAEELEGIVQALVDAYQCEWKAVVKDPVQRAAFARFAAGEGDEETFRIEQRDQWRPADWPTPISKKRALPIIDTEWIDAGPVTAYAADGGRAVRHGEVELAVFHYAATDTWYATQSMCPHRQDLVLARGLVGDAQGEPKVACPLHKKAFSLESGECLNDPDFAIQTFPAEVRDGRVYVEVPPSRTLAPHLCPTDASCHADAAE